MAERRARVSALREVTVVDRQPNRVGNELRRIDLHGQIGERARSFVEPAFGSQGHRRKHNDARTLFVQAPALWRGARSRRRNHHSAHAMLDGPARHHNSRQQLRKRNLERFPEAGIRYRHHDTVCFHVLSFGFGTEATAGPGGQNLPPKRP